MRTGPFDELESEGAVGFLCLAPAIFLALTNGTSAPVYVLWRAFTCRHSLASATTLVIRRVSIVPLSLDAVLVTVERDLQGSILEHDVTTRNANVKSSLAAKVADLFDQLLPALVLRVEVHLNVAL